MMATVVVTCCLVFWAGALFGRWSVPAPRIYPVNAYANKLRSAALQGYTMGVRASQGREQAVSIERRSIERRFREDVHDYLVFTKTEDKCTVLLEMGV